MTTLHQIGELLRSGVRPTDEETEHLKALGGFVAGMYGRFMGGHAQHLSSPADLWSGRLTDRLSAATGARWEGGLGLAELLLGSSMMSFWQIAREGYGEGYGGAWFDLERPMLDLYEDELEAPEVEAEHTPRRRRGSLFGKRQATTPSWALKAGHARRSRIAGAAGARDRLETISLAPEADDQPADGQRGAPEAGSRQAMEPMQRALWADGSLTELAVIRALAAGGLFVDDQVRGLEGEPGTGRQPSAPATADAALSQSQSRATRPISLDGLRIDQRTPALASALARVDTVFNRSRSFDIEAREAAPAISQERLGRLTASADYSIDRGYGSGDRPVYGFFDAVDTTYLDLIDDTGAQPEAEGGDAEVPASTLRRLARVGAARPGIAQTRATSQLRQVMPAPARAVRAQPSGRDLAGAVSLETVVKPGSGLRPFVAGIFNNARTTSPSFDASSEQAVAGRPRAAEIGAHAPHTYVGLAGADVSPALAGGAQGLRLDRPQGLRQRPDGAQTSFAFASQITHAPSGEPIVRIQRGGMSAPRYAVVEGQRLAERPLVLGGPAPMGTQVLDAAAGGVGAPAGGIGDVADIGVSRPAELAGPSVADRAGRDAVGIGAIGATSPIGPTDAIGGGLVLGGAAMGGPVLGGAAMGGPVAASGAWRLAIDGGRDLPLGATFSRHEVFAGTRATQSAGHSLIARPDFRPMVAGPELGRPSELSHAIDGLVWVTVPTDTETSYDELGGMGLKAVPTRKAAMVPAGLALQSIAGKAAGAQPTAGRLVARPGAPAEPDVPEVMPSPEKFGFSSMAEMERIARAIESVWSSDRTDSLAVVGLTEVERRAARRAKPQPARPTTAAAAPGIAATVAAKAAQAVPPSVARTATRGVSVDGARLERLLRSGFLGRALARAQAPASAAPTALTVGGRAPLQMAGREAAEELVATTSPEAAAAVGQVGPDRELGAPRSLAGRWIEGAMRADGIVRGLTAARFLDGAVGAGYGRIDSERQLLSVAREPEAEITGEAEDAIGARVSGPSGRIRDGIDPRLVSARNALSRPVVTGRESRAAASLFETLTSMRRETPLKSLVAQGMVSPAGSDEPVLGRVVHRINEVRAEAPLASRWDAPQPMFARVAALSPEAKRQVARDLMASGWTRDELALLSLAPGDGAPAMSDTSDVALQASTAPRSPLSADAFTEQSRASRMGRSLARIFSGSEVLGAPVDDRRVGSQAGAFAQAQAASWLPLLETGRGSEYFGELAPRSGMREAYGGSIGDAVGELVKMAETSIAASDTPVELASRRELLRRVRSLELSTTAEAEARTTLARLAARLTEVEAAGRLEPEVGAPELASRLAERRLGVDLEAVRPFEEDLVVTAVAGDLVPEFIQRQIMMAEAEQTKVALQDERGEPSGLEGRLAKALSLSTTGPAGVLRMLRAAGLKLEPEVTPERTREEATLRRRLRRGEIDEATLIRETITSGADPSGQRARTGAELQLRTLEREEARQSMPIQLGGVMAPEVMLNGLRSPEISDLITSVAVRRMQVGDDFLPVLTTLADSGVDLGASRTSLAPVPTDQLRRQVAREIMESIGGRTEELATFGDAIAETGERASQFGREDGRLMRSALALDAPDLEMIDMVDSSEGILSPTSREQRRILETMLEKGEGIFAPSRLGKQQKAGLLSAILRGTERAEMTAILEQAGGQDFAMAWLNRVDGSRSGIDIGMQEARFEFGKAFGDVRRSIMASRSPMDEARYVDTSVPAAHSEAQEARARAAAPGLGRGQDKSGLRSISAAFKPSSTGASRPQHGASQAMRRTDWSFVDTGSKASTAHADLGKLASAIVSSAEASHRAPMPLVAPAVKAVAQTALRAPTTESQSSSNKPGGAAPGGDQDKRGPVDSKMSEKAIDMLAIEMANRVARLMGLANERRGIW